MSDELNDPFATAALRERVLDAWAASPARFREDANAEEDYALGGYRDRVVVELAQNAADAAARAGVPGRLRLTLRDGTLVAANTGAPLDAAGVEALSTLRASSKRDDRRRTAGGRGGDGRPVRRRVRGGGRGQRRPAHPLGDRRRPLVPGADAGLRGRASPRWRASWRRATATCRCCGCRSRDTARWLPPDGFTTAVELPLRDAGRRRAGHAAAGRDRAGPAAGAARPGRDRDRGRRGDPDADRGHGPATWSRSRTATLTSNDIGGVVSRWRVAAAGGVLEPALLADRPAEERARTAWSVRWAVPVDGDGAPIALPGAG